jgi:hypothetical protein
MKRETRRTLIFLVTWSLIVPFLFMIAACDSRIGMPPPVTVIQLVKEYDFETGIQNWLTWNGGMLITSSSEAAYSGSFSLKIAGTADNNTYWNYAESSDNIDLPPGKYRLRGWILVRQLSPLNYPPLFKLQVSQGATFLRNEATDAYDFNHAGEWQELSVIFSASELNLSGVIAVDKRALQTFQAEIFIDDVKLELVQ